LLPLVILLCVVLAYANSFRGVFLFDDFGGIVRNPSLSSFILSLENTSRLLVGATLSLNYMIGGLKVADYHLVNLVIHIIAALFLYGIVRRTLSLEQFTGSIGEAARPAACAVATLWAVHPLQTGSVTYISQRAESLMGLFYFMALYFFVRGVQSGRSGGWHVASICACAIGMTAKPVMVTAPVLILCYDRFFIAGSFGQAWKLRRAVYIGLAGTLLVPAALLGAVFALLRAFGYASAGIPFSRLDYFFTEQGVVLHYLKLVFWPDPLCLDYGWPRTVSFAGVLLPGLVNGALLLIVCLAVYRRSAVGFCGLWFAVTLAPTSSFFPLGDYAAEHRLYLALAGIIAMVVVGGYQLLRKRVRVGILGGLMCILVMLCMLLTYRRNMDYYSEEAMWSSVVASRPLNLRAGNNYAVALSESGKTGEAIKEYNRVLLLIPAEERRKLDSGRIRMNGTVQPDSVEYNYCLAHANMGLLLYSKLGRNEEAMAHYTAALRVIPFMDAVRRSMRTALLETGVSGKDADALIEKRIRAADKDATGAADGVNGAVKQDARKGQ
jgi:tetratricopeptide (TPR) repeat protein